MQRVLIFAPMRNPKRPKDTNQRVKYITDLITGEVNEPNPNEGKSPMAVKRGRLSGLKGGAARAKSLIAKKRKSIAKKAAKKRWSK